MFYHVFKSVWKNKWNALIVFILLFITSCLFLISFTNAFAFYKQQKQVENLIFSDTSKTYVVNFNHIEDFDRVGEDIYKIKSFINQKSDSGVASYDGIGEYFTELVENEDFLAKNRVMYQGTIRERTPEIANVVFFDPNLLKLLDIDISYEEAINHSADELPIFVGSKYKEIIPLGKRLTLSGNEQVYIVKGYMENQHCLNDDDPITMPIESLDDKFLAPFAEIDKKDPIVQQSTMGKILFATSDDRLVQEVSSFAESLGIKVRIKSVSSMLENYEALNAKTLKGHLFLSLLISISSLFSIVITLTVYVILNRRNYGILIAFGFSKLKLVGVFVMEYMLVGLASTLASFLIVWNRYNNTFLSSFKPVYLSTLTQEVLLAFVVFFIVNLLLSVLVPVFMMKNYQPSELIKEYD